MSPRPQSGYATLAGVAFTPDLYAAAVAIVAPSNLITLLDAIPRIGRGSDRWRDRNLSLSSLRFADHGVALELSAPFPMVDGSNQSQSFTSKLYAVRTQPLARRTLRVCSALGFGRY
jgi:hypothetical protein